MSLDPSPAVESSAPAKGDGNNNTLTGSSDMTDTSITSDNEDDDDDDDGINLLEELHERLLDKKRVLTREELDEVEELELLFSVEDEDADEDSEETPTIEDEELEERLLYRSDAFLTLNSPDLRELKLQEELERSFKMSYGVSPQYAFIRQWAAPTCALLSATYVYGFFLCLYRQRHVVRGDKWENRENVSTKFVHLDRLPGHIHLENLPGEYGQNPLLTRLVNAFEAKRGEQLYRPNIVLTFWENFVISTSLFNRYQFYPPFLREWVGRQTQRMTQVSSPPLASRRTAGLEPDKMAGESFINLNQETPIIPRVTLVHDTRAFQTDTLTESWSKRPLVELDVEDLRRGVITYRKTVAPGPPPPEFFSPEVGLNLPLDTSALKPSFVEKCFIRGVNTFGYTKPLAFLRTASRVVEQELRHCLPLCAAYPGNDRLEDLPKGLLLSGPSGNGRDLFVRALAGDSRLPLYVTESNRFADHKWGLLRLLLAFRRARSYAPNILFLRDLDMITRDRETNRNWRSVRTTTQFLLSMDGYQVGSEEFPSQRSIFVIGTVGTTAGMDPACLRSGRFEWVLQFRHPFPRERAKMLRTFSLMSSLPSQQTIDWQYLSLGTKGYSISDLRSIVNSSALTQVYTGAHSHTQQSVKRAIGMINALRDKTAYGVDRVDEPGLKGLFEELATHDRQSAEAEAAITQYKIDNVYVQKKVLQLLRLIVDTPNHTTGSMLTTHGTSHGLAKDWAMMSTMAKQQYERDENQEAKLIDGVLALFSEVVFFADFQQVSRSPVVFFDTYCFSLASQLQSVYLPAYELQLLTQYVSAGTFIRAFDMWETVQPPGWTTLSYRGLAEVTQRFYLLNTWYVRRPFRFHFKEQRAFGITNEFVQPTPSDPLESLQTKPRDIREQYTEDVTTFFSAATIWAMMFTRLREQHNVYFMRRPLRAHSPELNMYGTFGTAHFFTQKEWKKVVDLQQVATELLILEQVSPRHGDHVHASVELQPVETELLNQELTELLNPGLTELLDPELEATMELQQVETELLNPEPTVMGLGLVCFETLRGNHYVHFMPFVTVGFVWFFISPNRGAEPKGWLAGELNGLIECETKDDGWVECEPTDETKGEPKGERNVTLSFLGDLAKRVRFFATCVWHYVVKIVSPKTDDEG